jgi:hypothetical protein
LYEAPLSFNAVHRVETKSNWQAEWGRTVQVAKKEGSLSLYLFQGEGELGTVVQLFRKKYPEIIVVTIVEKALAQARIGRAT